MKIIALEIYYVVRYEPHKPVSFKNSFYYKGLFTQRTITILASTPANDDLFILSAHSSAALHFRARDSRMDSDWMSMFVSFISWKNRSESDSSDICAFIVIALVWTFNIENDF